MKKLLFILFILFIIFVGVVDGFVPPVPTNFASTYNATGVNSSWINGSIVGSNYTNSYNVFNNGTWYNETNINWSFSGFYPLQYQNLTIYAVNKTKISLITADTSVPSGFLNQIWYSTPVLYNETFSTNFTIALNLVTIGGGGNIRLALYNSTGGLPTTLVLQSASTPAILGWNNFTFSPDNMTVGSFYHMAIQTDNSNIVAYFKNGGGTGYMSTAGYSTFPGVASVTTSAFQPNMAMNITSVKNSTPITSSIPLFFKIMSWENSDTMDNETAITVLSGTIVTFNITTNLNMSSVCSYGNGATPSCVPTAHTLQEAFSTHQFFNVTDTFWNITAFNSTLGESYSINWSIRVIPTFISRKPLSNCDVNIIFNPTNLAPSLAGHTTGTGERINSTLYWANDSALELMVIAHAQTTSQTAEIILSINNTIVEHTSGRPGGAAEQSWKSITAIIPKGANYSVEFANYHHYEWREYLIDLDISGCNYPDNNDSLNSIILFVSIITAFLTGLICSCAIVKKTFENHVREYHRVNIVQKKPPNFKGKRNKQNKKKQGR